jgi:head-tail adaptor
LISKYRTPATYQEPTQTIGPQGSKKITGWTDVQPLFVEVRGLTGREALQNEQAKATATHAVEHWFYGTTPNPQGRYLLFDGRTLYPTSVIDPDGMRRIVVAMCTETRNP